METEEDPEILRPVLARVGRGWGRSVSCGEGWWPIIARLDRDIAALAPDYEIHQVKEKFGGLRYYVGLPDDAPDDEIDRLIAVAEEESSRTCEVCGQPGRLRGGGWVLTLCDVHSTRE